jgi:hypothetical protein
VLRSPPAPPESRALGEVVKHAGEFPPPSDHHLAHRQMESEDRPIPSAASHVAALTNNPRVASRQIAFQVAVVRFMMGRRHQYADVSADDFRFGVTEQFLRPANDSILLSSSMTTMPSTVVLMMASSRSARDVERAAAVRNW